MVLAGGCFPQSLRAICLGMVPALSLVAFLWTLSVLGLSSPCKSAIDQHLLLRAWLGWRPGWEIWCKLEDWASDPMKLIIVDDDSISSWRWHQPLRWMLTTTPSDLIFTATLETEIIIISSIWYMSKPRLGEAKQRGGKCVCWGLLVSDYFRKHLIKQS